MEEGDVIGLALARASELRAKITACLDLRRDDLAGAEEEEEEEESLVSIRDALESLEQQLAALQALQQQQRYEREANLVQIDRSRMILLSKLKEYKGENLEVIHEASSFASESMERDDDLLLPPYPSNLPELFVLDELYTSSRCTSKRRFSLNGLVDNSAIEMNNHTVGSEKKESTLPSKKNERNGFRVFLGLVAKSVITLVSVFSILRLSGVKPKNATKGDRFKIQEAFHKLPGDRRRLSFQCPSGKVMVMDDGNPRCVVKERVEIPFDTDVTTPNVSYGFG